MDHLRCLQILDKLKETNHMELPPSVKDKSNPLNEYDDTAFVNIFRFSKDTVLYILGEIGDKIYEGNRTSDIPPMHQLLVALRFYATGTFQLMVGESLKISQPTCSRLIRKVSQAIAGKRSKFIKYVTFEELSAAHREFQNIRGFPGIVGLIGCTQIKIKTPSRSVVPTPKLYMNETRNSSLKVQVVSGAEMQIMNIVSRWYGSAHESTIFNECRLRESLNSGQVPDMLLGNAGYPLSSYLMTPLENPQTAAERLYNVSHAATSSRIQLVFRMWKQQFACLDGLRTSLDTSMAVIVAVAVLYNIALQRNELMKDNVEFIPEADLTVKYRGYEHDIVGNDKRLSIIEHYFTH